MTSKKPIVIERSNLLRMKSPGNGGPPEDHDPLGNLSGMRPAERLLLERSGAVIQLLKADEDGNTARRLARNKGVRVRVINRIISRHLREAA